MRKRMAYQPWVGLPNILSARIRGARMICRPIARPKNLAAQAWRWLDDPAAVAALQHRFTDLHHQLRRHRAARTDAIAQVLEGC
jgi:lipid-A-disaccharide synthase